LQPITFKALVADEDFGLSIGPGVTENLQLEQIALREVHKMSESPRLLPYVGPLRITYNGKEAFSGAISHVPGVAIGRELARELGITEAKTQEVSPLRSGIIIKHNSAGPVDQILIKEEVLDAAACKAILDSVAPLPRVRAGLVDVDHGTDKGIQ